MDGVIKKIKQNKPGHIKRGVRWLFLGLGWLNVGLAIIGVVVPGMPTTIFLIAACWAFSKSSEKFRLWLWNHPTFGSSIRNWHEYRVIPFWAKIMATFMMLLSLILVYIFINDLFLLIFLMIIMFPAALYINTRNSDLPHKLSSEHEDKI